MKVKKNRLYTKVLSDIFGQSYLAEKYRFPVNKYLETECIHLYEMRAIKTVRRFNLSPTFQKTVKCKLYLRGRIIGQKVI